MKKNLLKPLGIACCSLLLSLPGYADGVATLRKSFASPPDSVRISCYWYWLSGNVTKSGVVKDLQSMKQAGITRAFIGNIGLTDIPRGKVYIASDEWYDIVHTAMKTAGELGIEIGVFNSPGWSQAGGPWIKPEQAMRRLATTAFTVQGGKHIRLQVDTVRSQTYSPGVSTLAYRCKPSVDLLSMNDIHIEKADKPLTLRCSAGDKSATLRSLKIEPLPKPIQGKVTVYRIAENGTKEQITSVEVNRTNAALNVGFEPYAPIVASFPAVTCKEVEVVLEQFNAGAGIRSIRLLSTPLVPRYPEKTFAKMYQTPLPYWNEYKWPDSPKVDEGYGVTEPEEVIDLTSKVKDGYLDWQVPEGEWKILYSYLLTTGVKNGPSLPDDGEGWEVDKWSPKALAHHYESFIGKLRDRIPAADRTAWKYIVCDSYEQGGQNYTDDFVADFKQRYGYDPVPYLPVFTGEVIGSMEKSDRFLWDIRRMAADRLSYDHIGAMRKLANRDGFSLWLENYGHWGYPGEFLQYGGQANFVSGEFWGEGTLGDIENRAASSCGHIYGKRKVFAESFTCGGAAFSRYPLMMKQRGDRFFTEGINSTLLHLYVSQPDSTTLPGLNAPFGNEFNVKNTWFSQLDLFTDYLKRCNFLLQQGKYVADVAYFIGEDAPVMTGVTNPALPKGYQFDYINAEALERFANAGADHTLALSTGSTYRLLVLPQLTTMRPAVLKKIHQLVQDGVIVLGPEPTRAPGLADYPQADTEVRRLATELWGENPGRRVARTVGKGRVYKGHSIAEVFSELEIKPDCRIEHSDDILYCHTTLSDGDIYFLTNQSDKESSDFIAVIRTDCEGVPELWHPTDGTRTVPYAERGYRFSRVRLSLAPLESVFLVFGKDKPAQPTAYPTFTTQTQVLDTPWNVAFTSLHRDKHQRYSQLADWTKSDIDSIRHYSGEAVYTNTFRLKKKADDARVYLETEKIGVMAKVKINGRYAGGLWCYPYRLDITDQVKKGKNEVEITVVNTWINRLVGDLALPADQRGTVCPINPYRKDSPLQASGLTGDVKIIVESKSEGKE